MYWQEEQDEQQFVVPADVVDLAFDMQCKSLPVDHAYALSQAVQAELPWFVDEARAALHLIYGADSGNGWERPEGEGAIIYPSRRTKLILRLPSERVADAEAGLAGKLLVIDGHRLQLGKAKSRLLAKTNTLYSHYVAGLPGQSEEAFISMVVAELKARGLRFKKILVGKSALLQTPEGGLPTRSLLVGEMPLEDALQLQEQGLGNHQHLGCGVFIPHKGLS